MKQLYDKWLIAISKPLPIKQSEFKQLTPTEKIAFIRQYPPLFLPTYSAFPKPVLHHSLWIAGVGRLSGLRKAEMTESPLT